MCNWWHASPWIASGGWGSAKPLPKGKIGSIGTKPAFWRSRSSCSAWLAKEAELNLLDLDRLRAAPLCRDPFEFVVVEDFVRRDELDAVVADFPHIGGHGS